LLLVQEGEAELQAIGCPVPEEGFRLSYRKGGVDGVDRPLMLGVRTGSITARGSQWTFRFLAVGGGDGRYGGKREYGFD